MRNPHRRGHRIVGFWPRYRGHVWGCRWVVLRKVSVPHAGIRHRHCRCGGSGCSTNNIGRCWCTPPAPAGLGTAIGFFSLSSGSGVYDPGGVSLRAYRCRRRWDAAGDSAKHDGRLAAPHYAPSSELRLRPAPVIRTSALRLLNYTSETFGGLDFIPPAAILAYIAHELGILARRPLQALLNVHHRFDLSYTLFGDQTKSLACFSRIRLLRIRMLKCWRT